MSSIPFNRSDINWSIYASIMNSGSQSLSFSAKDGSGVMTLVDSALQIPAGLSNERPISSNIGMIRFNSGISQLEYYNGTAWIGLANIQPQIVNIAPLSVPIVDASITITGNTLGTTVPSIDFIGQDSIIRSAASVSLITPNSEVKAVLPSSVIDNSNQEPFAIRLTNNDYGVFTTTSPPLVIDINSPAFFVSSADLGEVSNNTIDASLVIAGQIDISALDTESLPITFTSANLTGATGLSLDPSNGNISGTLTNPGADTTYNFDVTITDTAGNVKSSPFFFDFVVPKAVSLSLTSLSNLTSSITYLDSGFSLVGGPVIGGYTIYRLTCTSGASDGSVTVEPIITSGSVSTTFTDVSYVLVAGGGGGGANVGGGGGAGGVLLGTLSSITSTNALVIGAYGSGGPGSDGGGSTETAGSSGNNTTGFSLTALGGGGGGAGLYSGTPGGSAVSGGSGGGEGVINDPSGPGSGTSPQGNDGGQSFGSFPGGAGGGGGFASVGANSVGNIGGDGGGALDLSSFLGTTPSTSTVVAGGGGGGGNSNASAPGGAGGSAAAIVVGGQGGTAGGASGAGSPAVTDTGSGGGGGSANYWTGGNGSSGVIYIRFPSYFETLV